MPKHEEPRRRLRPGRRARLALAGAGLLASGAITGAVVMADTRPLVSMAPATPVAIRSLSSAGIVTIRGRVAEVYGNKFVIDDGTGRALVDTGPRGDRRRIVTASEPVTVQGWFERGFVHAAFLVGPDNAVLALGPLGGPPPAPHGGPPPAPRDGPGRGPDVPPPPGATNDAPAAPPPAADRADE